MQKHSAPDTGRTDEGPGRPFDRNCAAAAERVEDGQHHRREDYGEREERRGDRCAQRDGQGLGAVEVQNAPPPCAESAQLPHVGPPAAHHVAHHQRHEEQQCQRGRVGQGYQGQAGGETLPLDRLEKGREARYSGAARQGFGKLGLQVSKPGTGLFGQP